MAVFPPLDKPPLDCPSLRSCKSAWVLSFVGGAPVGVASPSLGGGGTKVGVAVRVTTTVSVTGAVSPGPVGSRVDTTEVTMMVAEGEAEGATTVDVGSGLRLGLGRGSEVGGVGVEGVEVGGVGVGGVEGRGGGEEGEGSSLGSGSGSGSDEDRKSVV